MPATHPLAPFRRGVSRVLRRRPRLTDAIDWMHRFPVITITRRHPHIRQGSPLLRIEGKSLESLAALALFTFVFLGSELFFDMRMGMPMPLEGAVWAQALILGASVAGILALAALLRPPQAQIRAPFTETADPSPTTGRRATRRPTPSDSTLGSSAQSTVPMTNATPKPHPPKAEAPPSETYSPKGGTMGVVWKAAQRATIATFAERGTFHG